MSKWINKYCLTASKLKKGFPRPGPNIPYAKQSDEYLEKITAKTG